MKNGGGGHGDGDDGRHVQSIKVLASRIELSMEEHGRDKVCRVLLSEGRGFGVLTKK